MDVLLQSANRHLVGNEFKIYIKQFGILSEDKNDCGKG